MHAPIRPTVITISCVLTFALQASAGAADIVVYDNALDAGWQNWSWGTTANFANTSPIHGSSGRSIAVTHNSAWTGLYLHGNQHVSTSTHPTLRFSIHGGAAGGQALRLAIYNAAQSEAGSITLAPLPTGAWRDHVVPLSGFGTAISGIVWQENAGHAQPTYYIDDVAFIEGDPPPPGSGPSLSVNAALDRRPISPHIYGMNFADPALAAELALPVNRWGGNATTRYGWRTDVSNRASDYFYENIPNSHPDPGELPNGSAADRFVESNRAAGADTIITVPLIGWTPRARQFDCGYRISRYGPQQAVDPWQPDCGNGIRPDGTPITNNDPHDTSTEIDPSFVGDWVTHLAARYGTADAGGVRFYNLDNEPALWNSTHRDVRPLPLGYDELLQRTITYAAAIKAADPSASTLGPVAWGWPEYFYSALDVAAGGDWWNTRPDRRAHGDLPLIEWYLQQLRICEQAHGTRLLDYMDLHYYPQAAGVALAPAGDAATQARRLRSTRGLWDPTYVDESWIGETVRLIPRMRDWVAACYPGTKLAITEYNWGGLESINGALALSDVLGIFGREGLHLATHWDPPAPNQPGAWAFRMYRNHDGAGARFGETSVQGVSADASRVAIFAAQRANGALTLMLINKSADSLTSNLAIAGIAVGNAAAVYRYSAADLTHIVRLADLTINGGSASVLLPASSITLLVLPAAMPVTGDMNCDGVVTNTDVPAFVLALMDVGGYEAAYPGCDWRRADFSGDGNADGDDVAGMAARLSQP